MRKIVFIISVLLFFGIAESIAQMGTHDVLQTQMGKSLNSFEVLEDNPILHSVIQKSKGLEFVRSNGEKIFKKWKDIETVNFAHNEYHFDVDLDDLSISLLSKPYPYTSSEQKLQTGIIKVKGLIEENPVAITYFKVIFEKDLVIK